MTASMVVTLPALGILVTRANDPAVSSQTSVAQTVAARTKAAQNADRAAASAKANKPSSKVQNSHDAKQHKATLKSIAKRTEQTRLLANKPAAVTADGHVFVPGTKKKAVRPSRPIVRTGSQAVVPRGARSTVKQTHQIPKAVKKSNAYKLSRLDGQDPQPSMMNVLSSAVAETGSSAAGGSIAGTLSDKTTGLPVAGACATAYIQGDAGSPDAPPTACSDNAGHYIIGGLAAGSYYVGVSDHVSGHIGDFTEDAVVVGEDQATTGVNFALEQGGSISGTVTNSSGDPLKGVCVTIPFDRNGYDGGCTDAAGHYQSEGIPAGTWQVEFFDRKGPYLSQWFDGAASYDDATPVVTAVGQVTTGIDATMQLGGTISGSITDAATGNGIGSICVSFIDNVNDVYESRCADDTGHYTSPGLPTGSYLVRFEDYSDQGYRNEFYDDAIDADSATPVEVTLGEDSSGINAALVMYGRISGTVTAASSGDPIGGTCVEATDSDFDSGYATTNADGTYLITGMRAGSYTVKFGCDNWLEQWYDGADSEENATPVVVTDGTTASGVDAQLSAAGSISGTVTDAATGDPAASICVRAYLVGPEFSDLAGSAFTSPSGTYQITGLRTGNYTVRFEDCSDNGYISRWYGDVPTEELSTKVPVTLGEDTAGIDNAMVVGGKITGTVTEDGTGAPLQGICVGAFTKFPGQDFSDEADHTYTDDNGHYQLEGLEAGTYHLSFQDCADGNHVSQWLGGSSTEQGSTDVAVEAGATTSGIDTALLVGGSISGTVTDAGTGDPVGQYVACVSAFDPAHLDGDAVGGASTDESGHYSIGQLAPGPYVVSFTDCNESGYKAQYFDDVTDAADATPVAVTSGADTPDIDAALKSFGRITGTVTADDGGAPLANACVRAYLASNIGTNGVVAVSCTDEDGHYTLRNLADGQYVVRFMGAGTHVGEWYNDKAAGEDADLIRVETGKVVGDIDGALAPGGSISGTVVKDDSPLANSDTCAYLYDPATFSYVGEGACTDENGHYVLQGVPTGTYEVLFQRYENGYQVQWYDGQPSEDTASPIIVAAGDERSDVDADFTEHGFTISGTITREKDDAPVTKFCINVYKADGSYVKQICNYNTPDGTYVIGGLAAGSYKLQAVPFQTNDGVSEWYDGVDNFDDATPISVNDDVTSIDFSLRQGAVISGRVTDADTDAPLEGICGFLSGPAYYSYICTQQDGTYTSPDIVAGTYAFRMDDRNGPYISVTKSPITVALGDQVTDTDFALTKGGTFSGTLRDDATNAPVPNICVTATNTATQNTSAQRCSDSAGHYTTAGLGAGNYKLQFTNYDGRYVAEWYDNVGSSQEAEALPVVLGTDTPGIDASLQLGGIVAGTVTSSTTGEPLAGVCVKLYHASDDSFGGLGGCTGSDGTYASAAVPPGQYKVGFTDSSGKYVTQYYNGQKTLATANAVTVTAGGKKSSVDAAMAGNSIKGTVTDSVSGDPLESVCVYVYNSGGDYSGNGTCTGADGKYVLDGLPAGDYQVAFFDPAGTHVTQWYDGASSQAEATVLTTPADLSDVNAAMTPITTVAGTVTDSLSGDKLAGICAFIYKVGDSTSSGAACTSDDGRVVFQDLAPGDYQLAFADTEGLHDTQWYEGSGDRAGSTVIHVTEGSILTNANAALVPITTVVGTATDAVSGDPVSGVCAYLYPVGSSTSAAAACTSSDGKVVFQGIEPGSYQLAYADSGAALATEWYGGSHLRSAADTIVLTQGQAKLDADVALDKTGKITGTVSNGSGPVAGVCVYADDINGDYTGVGGCTDANGHYTLPDLSPGSYTVGYYPAGMPTPTSIWYLNAGDEASATRVTVDAGQTTTGIDQTVP